MLSKQPTRFPHRGLQSQPLSIPNANRPCPVRPSGPRTPHCTFVRYPSAPFRTGTVIRAGRSCLDSVPSLAVQAAHNLPGHRQGLPDPCRACRGWDERCTRAPHRERRWLLSPTRMMHRKRQATDGLCMLQRHHCLRRLASSLPSRASCRKASTLQVSALPAFWTWFNSDRLPSETREAPVPRRISFRIGAPPGNAGPTHCTEPETASHDRGTEIRPTGLHVPLPTNEPFTAPAYRVPACSRGHSTTVGCQCSVGEIHSRQQPPAGIECCDPFRRLKPGGPGLVENDRPR